MKYKNPKNLLLALASSLALLGPASAKPDGGDKGGGGKGGGKGDKGAQQSEKGKEKKGPDKAAKNVDKGGDSNKPNKSDKIARFADNDRSSIIGYFSEYQNRGNGLPPGLAKKVARGKPLPPGWQKKIEPGYLIEDDLWTSFSPVPDEWFPNIRREPDTRFYYHEDRVVRIYEPRREILDVVVVPALLR